MSGVKQGAPERQIFFHVRDIDIIFLDKHTHSIEGKKPPYLAK